MRVGIALFVCLPALAAIKEPRLEIVLRQDRTVGVRLRVPPDAASLDNAAMHQAISRAVGCLPPSTVRDRELQCVLPPVVPRQLVFRLRLRLRELSAHAGALRIDFSHPAAARNDFPAGWTRESPAHHWVRYEAGALPEQVVIETATTPLDLLTAAPRAFLAAIGVLLWAVFAPVGAWRYWGSVAGLAATLALIASSGMPSWIVALPSGSDGRNIPSVAALGIALLLLRFASRGVAHPASCRFLLTDRILLLQSAVLLGLALLAMYEVVPIVICLVVWIFLFNGDVAYSRDEQTAAWEWRKRHLLWQLPIAMVPIWSPPVPWPWWPALAAGLGILYWFYLPFRDAIIERQVTAKLGSPEPLAGVARKIQEQVFRW